MAIYNAAYAAVHNSAGKTTNPTTASVLADTGAVTYGGLYEVRILVGCSAAATFYLQHRDATNATTTTQVLLRAAAGQTGEYILKYNLAASERLRALPEANITGDAEITIQAIRVV